MLLGCQNDHTSHTSCTFQKKSFKNKYSSIASKQHSPPLFPLQPHLLCPGSAWSLLFCFMSTVSSWVSSSLIYLYLVHFPLHSQEWPFHKTDPAMSPFGLKQNPVCCPQDSCEIQHVASQAFVPPHWAATCPVSTHFAHPGLTKLWTGHPTSCSFKDALLYLSYICSFGLMVLYSCPGPSSDFPFPDEWAQIAHLLLKLSLIY